MWNNSAIPQYGFIVSIYVCYTTKDEAIAFCSDKDWAIVGNLILF